MNTLLLPLHHGVDRLKIAAWIALISLGSMAFLHAEITSKKPVPATTNSIVAPALDTAPNASPVPAAPAAKTPASTPHSFSIKIGADDDTDDDSAAKTAKPDKAYDERSGWTAEGIGEMLIPLFGILATFGMPVLIVFLVIFFKHRRRQEDMAVVRECISKGIPVPPQLLNDSWGTSSSQDPVAVQPITRGRSDIRRGIKYAAVGLGVSLALYIHNPHSTSWGWGLIVFVIGLGFLLSGYLETRPEANRSNPSAPNLPPIDGPR